MRLWDDCFQRMSVSHATSRAAVVLALAAVSLGAWAHAAPPAAPGNTPAAVPTTRPAGATAGATLPGMPPAAPGHGTPGFAGTVAPGVPATAPAGPPPKFRCDQLVYEFPESWSGDMIEHTWVINNDGQGVLDILNVQSTCGCTVPNWDKQILPGSQGKITVKFNSRGYRGEVTKNLGVRTNDPNAAQLSIQLKGKVKPRINIDPLGGIQFGQVTLKSIFPLSKSAKIINNTDKPFKIEAPVILPTLPFTCTIKEIEPGKVYEATVEVVKEKLKEGNNYTPLMLKTGIPEEPEVPLPVSLIFPPAIQIGTTSLAVATPVNATFHREIRMSNTNGVAMKILSVTANDPNIKVEAKPVSLPPTNPAPGAPPQPVPGQDWLLVVDIPIGWDPPQQQPQPAVAPGQPPQGGYEITATTDVPEKREVKIRVFTYPQPQQRQIANAMTLIGTLAPQAALMDASGKNMQVGGATGKVTVTAFFASWCGYCKKMLPIIQQMADSTYTSKGVVFNLISLDTTASPAQVAKVLNDLGIKLPYAIDSKQTIGDKYGAIRFPMTFVIGKDGVVEAVNQGCSDKYEQILRTQLDILLAGGNRTKFPPDIATAQPAAPLTNVTTRPANTPATPTAASLVVDSLQQDMGAFKPSTASTYTLRLRNSGGQPLNITSITPSAGLTIDPPAPVTIPANSPSVVTLKFTAPKDPGVFHHQVTIASNDAAKPKVNVALNGKVRGLIEVDPAGVVDFGRRPITFDMPRPAMITWNGEGALTFTAIETDSPKFEAEVKPVPQGPNTFMVWIKAKPPFEVGDATAKITVKTDCKEQPTIVIPVKLTQPQRVEVMPATAGVPKAARMQEATVAITNNGGAPLHILGVQCSNPKIRTQFWPEVDGLSYRMKVTLLKDYAPTSPDGDKVTIRTDDKEFGELVVPVKLVDGAVVPAGISQLPTQP